MDLATDHRRPCTQRRAQGTGHRRVTTAAGPLADAPGFEIRSRGCEQWVSPSAGPHRGDGEPFDLGDMTAGGVSTSDIRMPPARCWSAGAWCRRR